MRLKFALPFILLFNFSAHAFDEGTAEDRLRSEDVIEDHQPFTEDIDQILTNKQMRASSGSKSKWSLASGLSYSGGQISSPFSAQVPNISGATGATTAASASGSVSVKYAITARQALLSGVGLRWITPLQGTTAPPGYSKFDASNPYLNYQYIYSVYGIQSVLGWNNTYITASNLVQLGYIANTAISQNSVYEFGHSGVSLGASAYVGAAIYNKNDPASEAQQSDYSLSFSPFIEYQINDMLNFHTGWGLWTFEHIRSESSADTFRWDKVTQNMGIGIAVSRDFFLYPNLQFLPDNIRPELTTVALSANINLF